MYLIAIDPGKTGSYAVFKIEDGKIVLLFVVAFGLKRNKDWEIKLRDHCFIYNPEYLVMEGVHAMPGDTRRNAFAFGGNRRAVESALKFAGRKLTKTVDPKAWQRRCGLPRLSHMPDKAERRKINRANQEAMAIRLFPYLADIQGDVFASVLIGYASCLDLLGVARGKVAPP